jgi:GNAT superfamily N-acetyltransferase
MAESTKEIKVRRMRDEDLAKVNEVDHSLHGKRRVTTWPFSFEMYYHVYSPSTCFVAEIGSTIVGFISGIIEPEERSKDLLDQVQRDEWVEKESRLIGWIDLMGVHADHWGKGIGLALVTAFSEECKRNGATIRIVIKDDDEALKNFLIALDFKRSERVSYEKAP